MPKECRELANPGINPDVDKLVAAGVLKAGKDGKWCNQRVPILIPENGLPLDISCNGNCDPNCPLLQG
ncbi:hypothetical protein A2397_01965 [Candidatus Amesbacteria bacterium RIFOXYB1_FULL_44_23]|uniref:Uncharacterized protein n=1 Tax=Candidatus Amesbacteria bacterium RIFOXYB1_FULL_44_23 TaxID=1797263 RepID=A0A1F4ZVM4_9BACT|nr:MAG: hypothetical protein A2397_01965 [Candidatus Amesbacteria bacterium RIFOXYB1_FULL_44_23]